jgi:hypothetical protein
MVTPIKKTSKPRRKANKMATSGDATQRSVEKYAGDAYSLARRTAAGLNQIRKYINIEEKYSDVNTSITPDQSGTGSVVSLTQLAQGTTLNTRVGNSVRIQHFSLIGRVAVSSAVTTFSLVRVIVFRDMEGQGTAPTMSDVLEAVGSSAAPRQPYDYLNRKRFAIIADWFMPVTLYSGGGNSAREIVFDQAF